jgi:hypothetical protein
VAHNNVPALLMSRAPNSRLLSDALAATPRAPRGKTGTLGQGALEGNA